MTKEAEDHGIAELTAELSNVTTLLKKSKDDLDVQYRELKGNFDGLKTDNSELKTKVEGHVAEYQEMVVKNQVLTEKYNELQRTIQAPVFRSEKELEDHDTKSAIQIQKAHFEHSGNNPMDFVPDMANLVDVKSYRSAIKKLMKVGIESRDTIKARFTDAEKKAFEASTLGPSFFTPQTLALEVDCNIECAPMLDLYGQVNVGVSTFQYPRVNDYAAIGMYTCDAKCDAEYGPDGNIQWLQGKTFDWRGIFCFQRKVLAEANYDFLTFMITSAQRAYRMARNAALIDGDGINSPKGWLNANCFGRRSTSNAGLFTPQDWRTFVMSYPVEYGSSVTVMHQNMFGYLTSNVDTNGRFIFGDGIIDFTPETVRNRIRLSNCLPDATEDRTTANFASGSFIAAQANWDMAYKSVNKRPMFFEQYEGGSTPWCVKYHFGAEDGGFVACCPAGQILEAA